MNNTTDKVTVSLKFGDLDQVVEWCDRNCSEWAVGNFDVGGQSNGTYQFEFYNTADAALFILKWS